MIKAHIVYFPMREIKGANLDGRGSWEEVGRVKNGETLIRVYYGRKKSIFNNRKQKVTTKELIHT